VIVVVGSLLIAALQVRFTRGIDEPRDAARAATRAGAALAAACVLIALASGPGALGATALLVAGATAHLIGELLFVAASWGLSIPLMRADMPGQYQGVFATGEAAGQMAAPALMTTVVTLGAPGWLALGALFVAATAPAAAITRRATAAAGS
jgi:hypothetical protein